MDKVILTLGVGGSLIAVVVIALVVITTITGCKNSINVDIVGMNITCNNGIKNQEVSL